MSAFNNYKFWERDLIWTSAIACAKGQNTKGYWIAFSVGLWIVRFYLPEIAWAKIDANYSRYKIMYIRRWLMLPKIMAILGMES